MKYRKLSYKPSSGWSKYISTPDQFGAERMVDFMYVQEGNNWYALALLPSAEEMSEFLHSAVAEREFGLQLLTKLNNSKVLDRLNMDHLSGRKANHVSGYELSSRPYPELRPIDIVGLWRDSPRTFKSMLDANTVRNIVKNPVGFDSEGVAVVEARRAIGFRIESRYSEINPFIISMITAFTGSNRNADMLARIDEAGFSMNALMYAAADFENYPEVFYEALQRSAELSPKQYDKLVIDTALWDDNLTWTLLIGYGSTGNMKSDIQACGRPDLDIRRIIEAYAHGVDILPNAIAASLSDIDASLLSAL